MMEKSVRDKISEWSARAWPVSSHVSSEDAYKKAWGHFGQSGCSLVSFRETLEAIGFTAQLFGHVWIIRLPGPSPKLAAGFLKCEGI